MKVFAVTLDTLLIGAGSCNWNNPREIYDIAPNVEWISEMNKWVVELGMVPSIITHRYQSHRLILEAWMAKNNVPYSNYLVNVSPVRVPEILMHLDASVLITNDESVAVEVASNEAVFPTGIDIFVVSRAVDFNHLEAMTHNSISASRIHRTFDPEDVTNIMRDFGEIDSILEKTNE